MDQRLLWDISHGLYVVSSFKEGQINGQIADSLIQICNRPPIIAISINKKNLTHEFIMESGVFSVGILSTEVPVEFVKHFGLNSGRTLDKYNDIEYEIGLVGCPIVSKYSLGCMDVKVLDSKDVGTHTLFIGEVVEAKKIGEGEPLTYREYKNRLREHALSSRSPDYVPPDIFKKDIADNNI